MVNRAKATQVEEILPEYDFSNGERGRYLARYRAGTNVVLLDPDIAAAFSDSAAVNDTLRLLVNVARTQVPASQQAKRTKRRQARASAKASKAASARRRSPGR